MRDPPPHPDLKIGQSLLAFVSTAKVLGVWIQNDLRWDIQVDYMSKNANKRLLMLRSLKRFGFNQSELVTVYKGYIRQLLEYSDVMWHSSLTSNQTYQLERVQKRALRIILRLDYVSYENALYLCDVDRLSAQRVQHSLKFAQSFPNVAGLVSFSLRAEARYMVGNWGTTPNSPSPVLALIDTSLVLCIGSKLRYMFIYWQICTISESN